MKNMEEVGFVQSVRGSVAYLDGLPGVGVGELLTTGEGPDFQSGGPACRQAGFVGSLLKDRVEVFLLTDEAVKPGQMFRRSGKFLGLPVGDFLLGRAINPLGQPVDGLGPLVTEKDKAVEMALDQPAVGISGRRFITEQFDTGISVVDTILPIGRGQRELIIGEQRSGKTQFLLDIIANLKGMGVICVYGLIGKPVVETRSAWAQLSENKLMDYTVLVMSTATDPTPLTFLTAQSAMTVASYFQRKGKDVLVILDDMGVQARNYREMALVSQRPPGRESYPGDIFHQQARLLERAGCFKADGSLPAGRQGGGSITALPVIELVVAEFSAFIPTNLMGMTDGHLLFKSSLSQQGKRPAIDLFLSVTRVGGQTQERLQNALATKVKEVLARGSQLEIVSRFGSELPAETKATLLQKQQIEELLNQRPFELVPKQIQTVFLALPFTSWLRGRDVTFVRAVKEKVVQAFMDDPELRKFAREIFSKKDLPELFAAIETIKPRLDEIAATVAQKPKVKEEQEQN